MKLISFNPSTNKKIGSVTVSTPSQIKKSVAKARKAYSFWKDYDIGDRLKPVAKFTEMIGKNQRKLAELESLEMGKPYYQALEHLRSDINYLNFYLKNAQTILKPETIEKKGDFLRQIVRYPIGVSAVITPWNFPFTLAIWGIIPNLIVGNTVVFKPSELTPLCGQELFSIIQKADFPGGTVNLLQGDSRVGKELLRQSIDFVWFTGSSLTGREIYKICGHKFISCLLELGGSSPAVVFDDVNIKDVARQVFAARFGNCGQICSSVKRVFVHTKIFKKFIRELALIMENSRVGDPFAENTDFGPLVSKTQLELLQEQFDDAIKKGAKIAAEAQKPKDKKLSQGFYFSPTVLTDVNFKMRVMNEEVFGPVLPVMSFDDHKEVVRMANNTAYGLTALVYSKDKKNARQTGEAIDAGTVSLNSRFYQSVNCPFGGWKNSGMGIEGGKYGFWQLTRMKYIYSYDQK